jgi:hypothetical protein
MVDDSVHEPEKDYKLRESKKKTLNLNYRETATDTVKTLLAYGYIIESPAHDIEEIIRKRLIGIYSYSVYFILY